MNAFGVLDEGKKKVYVYIVKLPDVLGRQTEVLRNFTRNRDTQSKDTDRLASPRTRDEHGGRKKNKSKEQLEDERRNWRNSRRLARINSSTRGCGGEVPTVQNGHKVETRKEGSTARSTPQTSGRERQRRATSSARSARQSKRWRRPGIFVSTGGTDRAPYLLEILRTLTLVPAGHVDARTTAASSSSTHTHAQRLAREA